MTAWTEDTETRPTVTATAGGIEMRIDLHQMLTAIDPGGRWIGYDPENDEDRYEPSSLALQIADLTADRLAKAMRKEVKDSIAATVAESVTSEVGVIVRDALENGTVQRTTEWGAPLGDAKPLQQIILETATDVLTKPAGDPYARGGRQTVLQKMVSEAVGAAFKKELTGEVEKARAAALAAVQEQAAVVIRETVQRAARGL